MKVLICRFNTQKKRSEINIEKILFLIFSVSFALMVVVQAALLNQDVRIFLDVDAGLEGTPLEAEEYLYKDGIVVLKLLSQDTCPDLKILVNGTEIARFTENELIITVKDGDVIEADGSQVPYSLEVGIKSTSSNILLDSIYRQFKIDSSIKKLARIRIK
ncbi:MAG TPA: hypothetical protein GXX20_12255 [Clostridiaceae bacterium]|nr:hypothetical protein [Clostridiaceae bacterium]